MPLEPAVKPAPTAKSAAPAPAAVKSTVPLEDLSSAENADLSSSMKSLLEESLSSAPEEEVETEEAAETEEVAETPGDPATATEEAEAEPEEETEETETETPESEETEAEKSERKDWPQSAHKRVGKLTKKLTTLETEKAELETKLAERETALAEKDEALAAKAEAAVQLAPGVLSIEEQEIQTKIERKRRVLAWAKANPDGGEVEDGKGGKVAVTAEQIAEAEQEALEELSDARMELKELQKGRVALKAQVKTMAEDAHPWLKDKTSPKFQWVQGALRKYPTIAAMPEALLILADAKEMSEQRKAKAAEAARKAKAPVVPVKKPLLTKSPAITNGAPRVQSRSSSSKFLETGSPEDAREFVESLIT